jgi:Kef-type K+ transport system membrane component KefB
VDVKLPLLTSILALIVVSRLLAEFMKRLKQPGIVGEILAGVLLGPSILNCVEPTDHLAGISELSVFLIVLAAGFEMDLREVVQAVRSRGILVTILDFVIPLGSGIGLGALFRLDAMHSIFLGLCIAITALPVTIRILDSFGLLKSRIARYSISTAILNDVIALLCLGVILQFPPTQPELVSVTGILWSVARNVAGLLFFGAIVFGMSRLLKWGGSQTRYIENLIGRLDQFFGREAIFGATILFVLVFSSVSEGLGFHFVIGAFFGALLLSRDVLGIAAFSEIESTIHSITAGFLAPVFMAFLGLHLTASAFRSPGMVLGVLTVSIASKALSGWFGARWNGMSSRESVGVGIVVNGRGIMELVVANIAYQKGFIDRELFSILIFMGIFTTMVSPILFRKYVNPYLTTAERGLAQ